MYGRCRSRREHFVSTSALDGIVRPVAGVAIAVLGDACVVYHPPSKVVMRLNDTGSAVWLDLCEGEPLGADHVDFLHRLASLGLVAPTR